jgi:ABC-type transporter Mla MlaB component
LLRITVAEDGIELRLLLEGRLEEALVLELEKAFADQVDVSAGRQVVVDLSGLTGMDEAGESSLRKLYERGASLRCADVMNTYLVERMAHGPVKPLQAPCRPCHSNET